MIKLPQRIAADPAVSKALEIYHRGLKAKRETEEAYKRLAAVGVPQCANEFDEEAAAGRIRRAKRYDEIHETDTAAAEVAAVESERGACKKAHAKSAAEVKAAEARIEDARLEHEAAAAVASDTEGRLWLLVIEKARELLPELQAEYVKAAAVLRDQALELRATVRALENPLAPYDDARPFEFGVPLPWRNFQADEITVANGGIVHASGALHFE